MYLDRSMEKVIHDNEIQFCRCSARRLSGTHRMKPIKSKEYKQTGGHGLRHSTSLISLPCDQGVWIVQNVPVIIFQNTF